MTPARTLAAAVGALLAVATGCQNAPAAVASEAAPRANSAGPVRPVPVPRGLNPDEVALGARLFADPGLSADGTIACGTCHILARGGDDGLVRSRGVGGAFGTINAPTVLNSGLNFVQFWDGRAATLEDQVDGPLQNPAEMANTWDGVLGYLRADATYRDLFAPMHREGITAQGVRSAIATYERSLASTGGRFDRWLEGETEAITPQEESGYRLFQTYGCSSCHQGANVGGNMFQRMGVIRDYFRDRGGETPADAGRFNVTDNPDDVHVFRVPSLRMAVRTAPYFHDGSAATLDEAVQVMARYQLGREIPPEDRADIIAFLGTLPGDQPAQERP